MERYHKEGLQDYDSIPRWNDSLTRDDLVTISEIHLQQHFQQKNKYLCNIITKHHNYVSIKHVCSKMCKPYCATCEANDESVFYLFRLFTSLETYNLAYSTNEISTFGQIW